MRFAGGVERVTVGLTQDRPVVGWTSYEPCETAISDTNMHQEFEVNVVLIGGRECEVGDKRVEMGPGDVRLHPGWEPHGWRSSTVDECHLGVLFLPEFLGDESFDGRPWFSLFAAQPEERPRVQNDKVRRQLLAVAHELAGEFAEQRPGWMSATRLGVLRLLFTLQRDWHPPSDPAAGPPRQPTDLIKVMPAVELVRAHRQRRISLEEAAKACSLSITQFRFLFRRTMAMTYGQFALRSRLGHVADLLLGSSATVDAIAQQADFADSSHLNLHFRRAYGCTANEFRQRPSADRRLPTTG